MKQFKQQYLYTRLYMPITVLVILLVFSCSKDNGPRYDTPTISLGTDNVIEAKVGTRVSVPISFNAGGGAKSVVVFKNGGFLTEININADADEYTYETEALPASLTEGEELVYGFLISNLDGTDSETVNLTIRAELYDKVTIGFTELYELDIPTVNGIVPGGTIINLIQGRNYYLTSSVTFDEGSEVHIEEGVHVYVEAEADQPIEFIIGGKANIVGTADAPVVFTSSKTLLSEEEPEAGDWGQFRLQGSETITDNGIINYVRIEYAGDGGLRGDQVGAATNISHIQVFKSDSEGVYFTDGDARLKYIVATDCEEGSYRLGNSYDGMIQFAIAVSSEYFDENDDFALRNVATAPNIANITVLGPGTEVEDDTHGIRYRESTQAKIYNAIIAQFPRRAVRVSDATVPVDPNDWANSSVFAHSHVFDIGSQLFRDRADAFAPGASTPDYHNSTNAIAGIGVADFVPDAEQSSPFDPATINAFFTSAPFVGAVRNDAGDWTKGWVKNPDGSLR